MKKILIITGPAGDAQGWGDLSVTQEVCKAINEGDNSAEIAFVNDMAEFYKTIEEKEYDIIWSCLYYINSKSDTIGLNEDGEWFADIFDEKKIPYIGPNAATMKALINKTATHDILKEKGLCVPYHYQIDRDDEIPALAYPAFVKPSYESRSVGISDDSVVNSEAELNKRVAHIHDTYDQPALVEEYLPGNEFTVLMLGNGQHQEFLPGQVLVDPALFGKYPILRSDLRGVGATKIRPAGEYSDQANELCSQAMEALNCLDHVRADMRMDANGVLKIIEVNGIPGLKPIKSWSPQMFTMHHDSGDEGQDYKELVNHIVTSALARFELI
jgi:D-alanine-D-alanine ligase